MHGGPGELRLCDERAQLLAAPDAARLRRGRHVRPRHRRHDARSPARRLRLQGDAALVSRAPVALVLVLALSAPRTVAAEPCAPRAALDGDRDAVERVGAELVKLGVIVAPAAAPASARCPAVRATVELAREGGIAVAVRGSAQRSEGRVVSDAGVAAMWIDAWLRDDLDVATWAPESPAAP